MGPELQVILSVGPFFSGGMLPSGALPRLASPGRGEERPCVQRMAGWGAWETTKRDEKSVFLQPPLCEGV